jgi:lipooligosaccharide transport system ATP-binding protein
MKRRLQVARALISDPKVLVLDEPTTGLDPDVRRMLWEVLTESRSRGVAILLCTHYMEEAERLCDRVAILHLGKILDIDSPEKLVARHINREEVEEEVRPGVFWKRRANLEDVYLKLTGSRLGVEGL